MLINNNDGLVLSEKNPLNELQREALKACLKSLEGFSFEKAEQVLYAALKKIAQTAFIKVEGC